MQVKKGVPDSVNEPLDPNQPDTLVRGPFYKVLGKSCIEGNAIWLPVRRQAHRSR